jgi:hypothetical protein
MSDIYIHNKTKGKYKVLHHGKLEGNLTPVVIYQYLDNGAIYVRPAEEFYDGRFTKIHAEIKQSTMPIFEIECLREQYLTIRFEAPDEDTAKNYIDEYSQQLLVEEMPVPPTITINQTFPEIFGAYRENLRQLGPEVKE